MQRRLRSLLLAAAASVVAMSLTTAEALAHSPLIATAPEPGVRLEAPPRQIALVFKEPLNRSLTSARLISVNTGAVVGSQGGASERRRLILLPDGPLSRGAYRVEWHTVSSSDGHALEGSFSFGVRAAAAGPEHEVQLDPLARSGWMRVLPRGLLYAFGLPFAAALLLRARGRRWLVPGLLGDHALVSRLRDRERALTGALGWLALTFAIAAVLAETADAAGSLAPVAVREFLLSSLAGAARVAVVVALGLAAATWSRAPRTSGALVVIALGALAGSGHASAAAPQIARLLNDWLHLLSAAVWLGGIALIALVWLPVLRRKERVDPAVASEVLVAFRGVALPAFALVTATGVADVVMHLDRLEALWETTYGQLLALKSTLVGLVAGASARHAIRVSRGGLSRRQLERRHRLLGSGPALTLGLVAAIALLVAAPLPSPRLESGDEVRAAAVDCEPCALPRLRPDELSVADGAGSHLVAAWIRRVPGGIGGIVRVSDRQGRPASTPFEVLGARQDDCGAGCRSFRAPAAPVLRVRVGKGLRADVVALPARWRPGGQANRAARRILVRAQVAMRRLRSVREVEELTSGPGSYARTVYRLRAPDRMAMRTDRNVESVVIGRRSWFRIGDTPWDARSEGSSGSFRTKQWFKWTIYARAVRLLRLRRSVGRRIAELAIVDESTPIWLRLSVDLETSTVVSERVATRARFGRTRYGAFNVPTMIKSPRTIP